MADLTEAEFLGNEESFRGTGLIVSETGEMAIAAIDGRRWQASRINDAEASSLALMIQAVLG